MRCRSLLGQAIAECLLEQMGMQSESSLADDLGVEGVEEKNYIVKIEAIALPDMFDAEKRSEIMSHIRSKIPRAK